MPKCVFIFGVPLLLLGAMVAAIVLPWLSIAGRYEGEIIARQERLIKFLTVAAERPMLEQEIQRLKAGIGRGKYSKTCEKCCG
jgi:hypothetical protein